MLVAEQRVALVRFNQRRVHVQRRRRHGMVLLLELQQRLVHPPQAPQFRRHRWNERRPGHRFGRRWIVEPLQPAKQRRRRGQRAPALAPPAALQRSPFGARQQFPLDRLQNCRKAAVVLKLFDVFDAIAARQVQENNRKHHLDVEPALDAGRTNMLPYRCIKAHGLDQVDIDRKTGKRRQSMARRIAFILEIEKPLCQHRPPRW